MKQASDKFTRDAFDTPAQSMGIEYQRLFEFISEVVERKNSKPHYSVGVSFEDVLSDWLNAGAYIPANLRSLMVSLADCDE